MPLSVGLEAEQTRTAVGFSDPATGNGGISAGVKVTIASLDAGTGPAPMPQPCVATTSFDFTGGIDADGVLEVSQAEFEFNAPGEADCGGLGGLIGPMLEGSNLGVLTFEVGTA